MKCTKNQEKKELKLKLFQTIKLMMSLEIKYFSEAKLAKDD